MTTFVLIIAYLHTVVFRSFLMRACCRHLKLPLGFLCREHIRSMKFSYWVEKPKLFVKSMVVQFKHYFIVIEEIKSQAVAITTICCTMSISWGS